MMEHRWMGQFQQERDSHNTAPDSRQVFDLTFEDGGKGAAIAEAAAFVAGTKTPTQFRVSVFRDPETKMASGIEFASQPRDAVWLILKEKKINATISPL